MNLIPAARIMLKRICENKSVTITDFSDSIEQLFEMKLVYIEGPNCLKPTQKGLSLDEKMKR